MDREKPKVNSGLGRISMLIEKLLMLWGIQGAAAWEFCLDSWSTEPGKAQEQSSEGYCRAQDKEGQGESGLRTIIWY